jgi:hypothetical protein
MRVGIPTAVVAVKGRSIGRGNNRTISNLTQMGAVKEIRKQAAVAERAAARTTNAVVADQMRALAGAFRAQAEPMKKKKKKKK